ncbi:helix-turn-helix domain-containing protein [Streptomyces sp. NPDC059352]|uniref:helix-turn-helix domain-containing protein n=1 Tax=Streptomyces sp. NPDC059352 TaxID=3346810 RepID=UPI0036959076
MTQRAWLERYTEVVAAELRRHRELRGMSAQDLADECAKIGAPIQRSVIANLENGRRASVGVAEVLAFAAALRIPPITLMLPLGFEAEVEVLPGKMSDPYMAAYWMFGAANLDGSQNEGERSPMALADAVLIEVDEVLSLRDMVSSVAQVASSLVPERDRLKAELKEIEATFQKYDAEAENLDYDQSPVGTPEYNRVLAESRRILDAMKAVNAEMKKKTEELAKTDQPFANLERYNDQLLEAEVAARRAIGRVRERGLLPPKLPDEVEYLLGEPEPPRKPIGRPRSTRRNQSKTPDER